jgi:hypothetical protein
MTSTGQDRLVPAPVFILSSIRSGSTLLRCLLNSHSQIHAPHELHLRYLTVGVDSEYTELSLQVLGLDADQLRYLLWDRLFHRELTRSGKRTLVDKSPSNVWIYEDLLRCWPGARFIVLRRHPAAIVDSIVRAEDGRDKRAATELVHRFADAMDAALSASPEAPVVRYEDLITEPDKLCRELCTYLGAKYEPAMLDYGRFDHGPFVYGIGDWSDRIRSGRIQAPDSGRVEPEAPAALSGLAARWGY